MWKRKAIGALIILAVIIYASIVVLAPKQVHTIESMLSLAGSTLDVGTTNGTSHYPANDLTTNTTLYGVTQGSTIVACILWNVADSKTTMSDGQGTYLSAGIRNATSGHDAVQMFYLMGANAGTHNITATFSALDGENYLYAMEINTSSTFDANATGFSNSAVNLMSTSKMNTSAANSVIIGCGGQEYGSVTVTNSDGFTVVQQGQLWMENKTYSTQLTNYETNATQSSNWAYVAVAAAFTGLPLSDNFTYSDGSLETVSSNWTNENGNIVVTSGTIASSTGAADSYRWNRNTPANDQYSEITINSVGASTAAIDSDSIGIGVRMQVGSLNGYYCWAGNPASGDRVWLIKYVSGAWDYGTLVTGYASALVSGDKVRARANGTAIDCTVNGAVVASATWSNYTSGSVGLSGVGYTSAYATGDNWTGGNMLVAPAVPAPSANVTTVAIQYPTNTTYSSNSLRLNFTVALTAGNTLSQCWYTLGANNLSIPSCNNLTNMTGTVYGWNNVTVYANDTNNLVGSASIAFTASTPLLLTNATLNSTMDIITNYNGGQYWKNTTAQSTVTAGVVSEVGFTNSSFLNNTNFNTDNGSWSGGKGTLSNFTWISYAGGVLEANESQASSTGAGNYSQQFILEAPLYNGTITWAVAKGITSSATGVQNIASILIYNRTAGYSNTQPPLFNWSNATNPAAGAKPPFIASNWSNLTKYVNTSGTYEIQIYFRGTSGTGARNTYADFDNVSVSGIYANQTRYFVKFDTSGIPPKNTSSAFLQFNVSTAGPAGCTAGVLAANSSLNNANTAQEIYRATPEVNTTKAQPIGTSDCSSAGIKTVDVTNFINETAGNNTNVAFLFNESTSKNYTMESAYGSYGVMLNVTYIKAQAVAGNATAIAIQYPTNTTYTNNSIRLNFTVLLTGNTQLSQCWYVIGANNVSIANCANVSNMTGVVYGWNNVSVYANNTDNLIGEKDVSFTVTAAAANTCTPPSGTNWTIEASDNCVVSGQSISVTSIYIQGNSGTVTFVNDNITSTSCRIEPRTWYNTSWPYREKITLNSSLIADNNLQNFPVLINISDSNLNSNAQANGNDILFTSSDGTTKLDHEIENYTGGNLVAWVRIPSLGNSSNQTIYMYYGNSGAANQQNKAGVWGNNYTAVYHLNDNKGSSVIADARGIFNATNKVNTNLRNTSGQMDGAMSYNTSALDYSNLSATMDFSSGQITISAWAEPTNFITSGDPDWQTTTIWDSNGPPAVTDLHTLAFYYSNPAENAQFTFNWDGAIPANNRSNVVGSTAVSAGKMYYLAGTYDGATAKIYLNGSLDGSSATGVANPIVYSPVNENIGKFVANNGYFNGTIDELRISNISRSAAWIKTEYNNQYSPSTFESVSQLENTAASGTLITLAISPTVSWANSC